MKNERAFTRDKVFCVLALFFLLALIPAITFAEQVVITIKTRKTFSGEVGDYYLGDKKMGSELLAKRDKADSFSAGLLKAHPECLYRTYDVSGKLASEISYKNGSIEGSVKSFGPSGKINTESTWMGGLMNGLLRSYNENGDLRFEQMMIGGRSNGLVRMFYPDGQISFSAQYKDGQLVPGTDKYFPHQTDEEKMAAEAARKKSALQESAFKAVAKKYRAKTKKPSLSEDARKYSVQAEGATEEKRYADAVELYKKALEIAPWWAQGRYNRALLLGEIGKLEEAAGEMEKYLLLEPHASDARAAKDQIYKWQGKLGK